MKVTVEKDSTTKEVEYPWIGEAGGNIVLFTSMNCGMNISDEYYEYSDCWIMENFKKFKGKIIIEQ